VEPILIDSPEHDDDWYNEVVDYEDEPDASAQAEENPADDEIPMDIEENFDYLVKKKYNIVFLDGLTIPQVNEEYEKCIVAESVVPAYPNAMIAEEGEWKPTQEAIIVDDIRETDLRHQDPDQMFPWELKSWLLSRNYPRKKLKVLKVESLTKLVKMFQATEKKQKRIMTLDMNNPEYLEITKRTRILKPEEIVCI